MNFIFCKLKNLKKHEFHFFCKLKNLKKHEFHFFFASLKTSKNSISKAFARIQSKKGSKFDYMYKCKGANFTQRMNQIGKSFREVKMKLDPNDPQNS